MSKRRDKNQDPVSQMALTKKRQDVGAIMREMEIRRLVAAGVPINEDGVDLAELDGWDHESNGLSEITQSGEWRYEVIGNIYENPELLR